MVLTADQQNLRDFLRETIPLLCKSRLDFQSKFTVEAVIGLTIDDDDLFFVSLNENVSASAELHSKQAADDLTTQSMIPASAAQGSEVYHPKRKRKKTTQRKETPPIPSLTMSVDEGDIATNLESSEVGLGYIKTEVVDQHHESGLDESGLGAMPGMSSTLMDDSDDDDGGADNGDDYAVDDRSDDDDYKPTPTTATESEARTDDEAVGPDNIPGFRRGPGKSSSRWEQLVQDYQKICQTLLNCHTVMERTSLALVELNQHTLKRWHNKRLKKQEDRTLLQGMDLPAERPVSTVPLLPAKPLMPPTQSRHPFIFPTDPTTAGQAKTPEQSVTLPTFKLILPQPSRLPTPDPGTFQWILPGDRTQQAPILQNQGDYALSRAAQYRKEKQKREGKTVRERAPVPYNCSKCTQKRTAATGHICYSGSYWYCPISEQISKEQWLDVVKAKVAERKLRK